VPRSLRWLEDDMSDWLDEFESEEKREQRELEEFERSIEEEYWSGSMGKGVKKNSPAIRLAYDRILKEIDRAREVGGFHIGVKDRERLSSPDTFASGVMSAFVSPDVRCWYGPMEPTREVKLHVENDSFDVSFIWHNRPRGSYEFFHDWHDGKIPIHKIDDTYASYIVKWLATGQPEFQSASTVSEKPKGFIKRLFG
jgi:hypothetical protein